MVVVLDYQRLKKKAKTRYIIHLISIALIIALTIAGALLLLLLSNLDYLLNMVLDILLCSIVFIFVFFYFLNIFPIVRHYYVFFKNANEVSLEKRNSITYVEEAGEKVIDNVKYRNLRFSYIEKQTTYYENLYVLDSDLTILEGTKIKAYTYHTVIVKYEVPNNATI